MEEEKERLKCGGMRAKAEGSCNDWYRIIETVCCARSCFFESGLGYI